MLLQVDGGFLPVDTALNTRGILLGLLTALYPIGQFFGSPILGKLSDRYGRKPWLVWSIGGTAFGYLLSAAGVLTSSLTLLFVGRFWTGFCGGNSSICQSAVADISNEKSKGAYFSLLAFAMGIGFILGPVVGGRLADKDLVSWFGWDIPFWFSGLLAVFNTVLMMTLFKETLKTKHDVKINAFSGFVDLYHACRHKALRSLFATFFLFTLGWFFFAQFFQVYLIQRFNFEERQIGDTFTYIAIWYVLTQAFIATPLSRFVSPYSITVVSLPLLAIALLALLVPKESFTLWYIYPFVTLFVCLAWPNILAMISNQAGEKQGQILGVNQSINSAAQAITPIVSGPLVAHMDTLPTIIGSASAAGAFIVLLLYKLTSRSPKSRSRSSKL